MAAPGLEVLQGLQPGGDTGQKSSSHLPTRGDETRQQPRLCAAEGGLGLSLGAELAAGATAHETSTYGAQE